MFYYNIIGDRYLPLLDTLTPWYINTEIHIIINTILLSYDLQLYAYIIIFNITHEANDSYYILLSCYIHAHREKS